jgi:hypothetical protein
VAIAKKSVTNGTNTGTTATVSVTTSETPSATAVGDLVLVFHSNDFYTTTTMGTPTATGSPTLFAITGGSADGGANLGHINGWWYVANTAGAQTISVTETGTHDEEKALTVYVLSGADTTTPIDNATNTSGTTSTSDVAPSASPSTADAFVIAATVSGGGSASTGYTTPGPLTEDIDFTVGGLSGVFGSAQLSAAGATGTYTFTASTSIPWSAVTVTIRTGTAVAAPNIRPAVFVPPAPFGTPWRGPRVKPFQLLGDASSSSLTSVTLADTGTGDDALTVTATAALTDVGTGTDALSAAAAVPLADVGAGTDAVTVAAAVPLADVGAGSDAVTVAAAAALADVGSGTDTLAATVAVALSETGAGADTIATAAAVPLTDTATGTDAIAASTAVPLDDTATGADALTVTATVAVTDVGTGSDSLAVAGGTDQNQAGPQVAWMFLAPNDAAFQMQGSTSLSGDQSITLTDTGTGTDALAAAAAAALADTATGTDALSVAVTVTLTDTGTGVDALGVSGSSSPSLPDTATGTDALAVTVSTSVADTGTGTDALASAAAVTLTDTGTGADAISVSGSSNPALPDTASGADSINATVTTTLTETGTAVDGFSVVITSTLTDVGAGTDSITVARAVPLSETGSAADALTVVITVSLTDTGHGTEGFTNSRSVTSGHAPPLCGPRGRPVSPRPRGAQPFRSRRETRIQFGEVHHDPCGCECGFGGAANHDHPHQPEGRHRPRAVHRRMGRHVNQHPRPEPTRPDTAGAHLLPRGPVLPHGRVNSEGHLLGELQPDGHRRNRTGPDQRELHHLLGTSPRSAPGTGMPPVRLPPLPIRAAGVIRRLRASRGHGPA